MTAWLLRFVLLYGLWLALVDNHQRLELLVGGLAAIAGATLASFVGRVGRVRHRVRPRWILRGLAVPWWIARDSAVVLLGRGGQARSVAVPWPEESDEALAAGRFMVAGTLGSMGPNSYALGVEDEVMVVHQLVAADDVTPARIVDR